MSMSSHVVGFIPPDDEWKKKKAAWDACKSAGVEPPLELCKFFGDSTPDNNGREIDLTPYGQYGSVRKNEATDCAKHWWGNDHGSEGFEVDLAKLPPNVKILRFYNSY